MLGYSKFELDTVKLSYYIAWKQGGEESTSTQARNFSQIIDIRIVLFH